MSPLKANVSINGCPGVMSVSVGKANTIGGSRIFNVRFEDEDGIVSNNVVAQYIVTSVGVASYGIIRCDNEGGTPIGICATLAGCQAAILADIVQFYDIEVTDIE